MPEIIAFPVNKVAPSDWLMEDLVELHEIVCDLPVTETSIELRGIIDELIQGRGLELAAPP
jgi:hypothetical protein